MQQYTLQQSWLSVHIECCHHAAGLPWQVRVCCSRPPGLKPATLLVP